MNTTAHLKTGMNSGLKAGLLKAGLTAALLIVCVALTLAVLIDGQQTQHAHLLLGQASMLLPAVG